MLTQQNAPVLELKEDQWMTLNAVDLYLRND